MLARWIACAAATGALTGAVGCAEDDDTDVFPGGELGLLVASWSIEGTKDPALCARYAADRMRIVVSDTRGVVAATQLAPCSAFAQTIPLETGVYSANATFVTSGIPVSDTIELPGFSVLPNQTALRVIDFPASAMR